MLLDRRLSRPAAKLLDVGSNRFSAEGSALSTAMPCGPLKLAPLGGVSARADRPLANESTCAAPYSKRTLHFILYPPLVHAVDFADIRDGNLHNADTAFQL